jgi:hypothetical protein
MLVRLMAMDFWNVWESRSDLLFSPELLIEEW